MSKYNTNSQPEDRLTYLDTAVVDGLEFPQPQPTTIKYSFGLRRSCKWRKDNLTAHEIMIPRSYQHPDCAHLVLMEIVLQRLDYWFRETYPSKSKTNPRLDKRYLLEAEKRGLVPAIEGPHKFRVLPDSDFDKLYRDLKNKRALKMDWTTQHIQRRKRPQKLYYHCCDTERFTQNGQDIADMLSQTFIPTCGKCTEFVKLGRLGHPISFPAAMKMYAAPKHGAPKNDRKRTEKRFDIDEEPTITSRELILEILASCVCFKPFTGTTAELFDWILPGNRMGAFDKVELFKVLNDCGFRMDHEERYNLNIEDLLQCMPARQRENFQRESTEFACDTAVWG